MLQRVFPADVSSCKWLPRENMLQRLSPGDVSAPGGSKGS
eukprot:CAMPEP_0172878020 /NCGR_PEP_ID=MMETSP1075-20121228/108518_1 /TAXON_ID=2916 /ORGANISM="Ceratium fusus, Strain PA161109" /LENGTH=39 /DNA_ID= /DNA_START= /DNA_END= /DNA_ORIENTATION=